MKTDLLGFVVVLALCAPGAAGCTASAPPLPRLLQRGGALYVDGMSSDLTRSTFLYALSERPLNDKTRARIGLLTVLSTEEHRVGWYCRPAQPLDAKLAADGVPVEAVKPNTDAYMGSCWAKFEEVSCKRMDVCGEHLHLLRIGVGHDDGTKLHRTYDLLGPGKLDLGTREGILVPVGTCTVEEVEPLDALCVLDDRVSTEYLQHVKDNGPVGHAHLRQSE